MLANATKQRNETVTDLLNGTLQSIKNVVPMELSIEQPKLLEKALQLEFGVLVGVTGDVKGKLILTGDRAVFASIGETMFGMPLEGEMLDSFSGELGNMIAGGLSTNILAKGVEMDITSPTIMQGNTKLTGYEKALRIPVSFHTAGEMSVYLLLD